jgi:hypothetical protein
LDFTNGKPKRAVENLVSVMKPATLKALIESNLKMDKFDLKKDFLEFVTYLENMAITHDEHCHAAEHKKTGDSGIKDTGKSSDSSSRSSGHNSGGSLYRGASNKAPGHDRTKSGHDRSSDSTGPGKQSVREPPPCINTTIRGERDKQTCSATEMLMSAVTITTPSGPLCIRGVREIIVEEDMEHPLIGRPVLDEMGFVAIQHLDSVRDKFHLHDFSHIGEELLDMGKQPLGTLSKLLLIAADIPDFIEDLPDVLTLAKKKHEASGAGDAERAC